MDFIKVHKDEPFMAVLAHYAVHTPTQGKKHITKRYEEKLAARPSPDVLYEKESAGENSLVANNPGYAAMVESVDKGAGRLLNLLVRLEIANNTIVVPTSDHGGLSSCGGKREVVTTNRPLRAGKGHLYEGGVWVPLMVRWPGKTKGGQSLDTPVVLTDLFPSFLEMARLPMRPDAHKDGLSFAGLLQGEIDDSPVTDRLMFWHNPAPRPSSTADFFSLVVRLGDLKLIDLPTENRVELHDLSADVGESRNLAETRPDDTANLLKLFNEWRRSVGASDQPRARKKETKAKQ